MPTSATSASRNGRGGWEGGVTLGFFPGGRRTKVLQCLPFRPLLTIKTKGPFSLPVFLFIRSQKEEKRT